MTDMDSTLYERLEKAILTFIKDHPNVPRHDIEKTVGNGLNPDAILVVLHRLKSKALIESYFERFADAMVVEFFRPARLDRK